MLLSIQIESSISENGDWKKTLEEEKPLIEILLIS